VASLFGDKAYRRSRFQAEHQKQKEAILQVSLHTTVSLPWSLADGVQDAAKDRTVDRFIGVTENLDERLKKSTIGLVTLEDFNKTKEDLEEQQRKLIAQTTAAEL
jgi:protein FAM50